MFDLEKYLPKLEISKPSFEFRGKLLVGANVTFLP